jgi:hypothetical protein
LIRLFGTLAYIAGLVVWFPSFALFSLASLGGYVAGIQLPLVVFPLVFIVGLIISRGMILIEVVLLCLLWSIALVLSTAFSPEPLTSTKGVLLYESGFMVFIASSYIARWEVSTRLFMNGYVMGGVISSLYGAYQLLAWRVGLPYSTLLNNNPNFPSFAAEKALDPLSEFTRAFAFTTEPSVLASMLIPAFLVVLYRLVAGRTQTKHDIFQFAAITVGLVVTSSASLLVSLPIALLLIVAFIRELRTRALTLVFYATVLALVVFSALSVPVFQETFSANFYRFGNLTGDQSLLIRAGAMHAAVEIFIEHPLTGYGPTATADIFAQNLPPRVALLEPKTGVDSMPLSVLSDQGVVGLVSFGAVVYFALRNSRQDPELLTAIIALLVVISLQTGYPYLYHIWALLGLGVGKPVVLGTVQAKKLRVGNVHSNGSSVSAHS